MGLVVQKTVHPLQFSSYPELFYVYSNVSRNNIRLSKIVSTYKMFCCTILKFDIKVPNVMELYFYDVSQNKLLKKQWLVIFGKVKKSKLFIYLIKLYSYQLLYSWYHSAVTSWDKI